ncbi:hypothetical protein ACLOJK_026533 [Asimina triloba]
MLEINHVFIPKPEQCKESNQAIHAFCFSSCIAASQLPSCIPTKGVELSMGQAKYKWFRAVNSAGAWQKNLTSSEHCSEPERLKEAWPVDGPISGHGFELQCNYRRGAQLVVLEGKRRQVWENAWCDSCLDLHLMSSGAAQAMVFIQLLRFKLHFLCSILTGWGKHSKVVGDSTLRRAVEALLAGIGAPFHVAKFNVGRFISTGPVVTAWLRESGTLKVLILHDDRANTENGLEKLPDLQALVL